jgi:DNA/RNA non-specific endonuclease
MSIDGGQRPPDPPRPPPPPEDAEDPVGSWVWEARAAPDEARAAPDPETPTDLPPNATIETEHYQFGTDDLGRLVQVTGELELKAGQREQWDADRVREMIPSDFIDEAGHLIAARFNAPGDHWNMVPQDFNLNHSEWRIMENEWAKALKEGYSVHVDIALNYDGKDLRPWAFNVEYTVSSPEGEVIMTEQRDILNAPRAAKDELNPR